MSELLQLEKLQKTIRELKELKIIDMPNDFIEEARKISREQIFVTGQLNMLIRVRMILDKYSNL